MRQQGSPRCPAQCGIGQPPQTVVGVFRQSALESVDVSRNHGQEIVEIVGNTAGELTYGFHLLRLTHALFRGPPLRQIARNLGKPNMCPSASSMVLTTAFAQKMLPSLRTRQPSDSYLPVRAAVAIALSGSPRCRSSSV